MKKTLVTIFGLILFAAISYGQGGELTPTYQRCYTNTTTMKMVNIPIKEAVQHLEDIIGIKITLLPGYCDIKVTFSVKDIPVTGALEILASYSDCTVLYGQNDILLEPVRKSN